MSSEHTIGRVVLSPAQLAQTVQYKKDSRSTAPIEELAATIFPDVVRSPPPEVANTLTERGSRYGDFANHARVTQSIMTAIATSPNWRELPAVHRQALTVIADKIARILTGDPNYEDNWHDIQGYARLVEKFIQSGNITCL